MPFTIAEPRPAARRVASTLDPSLYSEAVAGLRRRTARRIVSVLLRPLLARAQQVARNHLGELTYVGRRHAENRGGIAGIAARLVERARPQPFEQSDLGVGQQRNLRVREDEEALLVQRIDAPPRRLHLASQLRQRTIADGRFDFAEQVAGFDRIG